tara:strand:+ start:743 stop:2647 length:1905 start_codon:yes stop_codon:yes gene_type:complete
MILPIDLLKQLESSSSDNRYLDRISALRKSKDFDTSMIEEGVTEVNNVLEQKKGNSFVVYGEPQSGKTEFMIALTCNLLDKGYRTIFIIMNDNTQLEAQNFRRFLSASQLNPSPISESTLIGLSQSQLKQDIRRVIFCRKNSGILEKLIENSRHFTKRVVIDDEADYATPDTNINKQKEASKINERVSKIVQLDKGGVYIGVTATPGRLDLNNTLLNKSKDWVFLKSHSNYKGREFFFPFDKDTIKEKYILKLLKDDYDNPRYLKHAAIRFLLRSMYLNLNKSSIQGYSMLIHTAGKTMDHEEDKKVIDSLLDKLRNKDQRVIGELIKIANDLFDDQEIVNKLCLDILRFIGMNQVLVINNKNKDQDKVLRACQPEVLFTFAIGGNIVSRGLTFENLLSFFFSRNVKGKMTQNTYIQRARMFGNRPYSSYFELCVPKSIFENWANVFEDHELSLSFAKSGDLAHVESKNTRSADSASIDKANILVQNREQEVGLIFNLTNQLEERILLFKYDMSVVDFIEKLIAENFLKEENFPLYIRQYIKAKSTDSKRDQHLLLTSDKKSNQAVIYQGNKTSQWDDKLLKRTRGGLIQSIVKGRNNLLMKKHFIFPVKSIDGKRARFIYRSELGKTILKNLK